MTNIKHCIQKFLSLFDNSAYRSYFIFNNNINDDFSGSYQGQWQEGKRHGYGVRTSAPFGLASHYRPKNIQTSMTSLRSNEGGNSDPAEKRNHRMDDIRGGFVLKMRSDEQPLRRNSLVEKTRKGLLSVSYSRKKSFVIKRSKAQF